MTINELENLLKENYSKGGRYDDRGFWRCTNEGNTVYLSNNKGGWAYICKGINGTFTDIVKYSIRSDGSMKNCGKFRKSFPRDMQEMLTKATKYAIKTPYAEINDPLCWKPINEYTTA